MNRLEYFEYIRIKLDFGDLDELNRFGGEGWRLAAVIPERRTGVPDERINWALLERKVS